MRAFASASLVSLALAAGAGCGTRALLLMAPPPRSMSVLTPDDRPVDRSADDAKVAPRAVASPQLATLELDRPTSTDGGAPTAWSALPAPHRAPKPTTPAPTPRTAAAARALTGTRDPRTPLAYALAVAGGLTGQVPPDVADGAALVAWAGRKGGLAPYDPDDDADQPPAIEPGDLLVFDRVVGGAPASLVAVVLGRDARGVLDVTYLAAGVIRRGFVDPTRPRVTRDRERAIVNSFLRHTGDAPPRGTRFRAGELLAARIRLPR